MVLPAVRQAADGGGVGGVGMRVVPVGHGPLIAEALGFGGGAPIVTGGVPWSSRLFAGGKARIIVYASASPFPVRGGPPAVAMDQKCAQNLKPDEMVALLRANGRAAFEKALDAPVLLVRIEDARGDLSLTLEAALEEGSTSGWRPEPSLGFETVVGSSANLRSLSIPVGRSSFAGTDLARRLQRSPHFAITLHKRRGATNVFSERISVGRARTNDIVLRHHSVSKFHAWFECDEDDRFYVCDAKSTNATLLNGTDIRRASQVPVAPGDEVRFGDIVTVFCPPEILWDAVMLGGGPPSSRSGRPLAAGSVRPPLGGSSKPPPGSSGKREP